MILGIGCLLIGLIGLVILQLIKAKYIEGFELVPGTGCSDCEKFQNQRRDNRMTESDYLEYESWCGSCPNCMWDAKARNCVPNPDYVEPDEPDTPNDPCSKPCTEINGERACNSCAKCISCVGEVDLSNPGSDNRCIDRKDYTADLCPGTDPSEGPASASDNGPDVPTSGSDTQDDSSQDSTSSINIHTRDEGTISDDIDYSNTESEETSTAKEKNRQAKFLHDIQSIVHNELLNEQGMTTANSQDYLREKKERRSANSKPNQKKGCPDMSEYIRKDSIPCWGCNLD